MFKALFKTFVFSILLALVLFGLPSSSMSQGVEAWSNFGLYGGQMYDIAIDPSNPDKMFAGSYLGEGLFVTEDGGSTWRAVETENELEGEDTFDNHAVWAVKIAPSNTSVVWAAHNYWVEKSTDGGQTWTHIRNSSMQRDCPNCGGVGDNFRFCTSLAIDPTNPDIVYVGTYGPYGTYSSGAIYRTVDGGITWTKTGSDASNEFDYTVVDIDIDPQDSNIIWAVTSSYGVEGWAGTLYRSENGGETWTNIMTLDSGFLTVAVKPNDSNTVFTGSGYGIIKHYFDDTQWQYVWPVIPDDYPNFGCRVVQDIAFDPQNPEILYAGWKNPWFGDFLPKVSRSINGGIDWETYTVDYEFLCLAVDPTNSEVIFGGELYLGVYKSQQDYGQTWTALNNGINAVIVYDVAIDPNDSTDILAGTISGVYEKKGAGDWSRLVSYGTASLQFHPTNSLIFYAGLWGRLAKTTNGGGYWDYTNLNVNDWVKDIAINPTDTDTMFVAVGEWILKSTDGGGNFEDVLLGQNQSGESYDFNVVLIDPSDSQHIFAGGGNFYTPRILGDLWESTNGGDTWDRTSLQNVIVNDLLIDPQNPSIMYAGCGYSGGTDVPVYKSTDGGGSWSASYEGIPGLVTILMGVWGSSATDVFVVGKYGTAFAPIFHYNGSAWAEMDSGTTEDLTNLWGSSGTNVFAVGTSGTIIRYDGNTWSAMSSGITENLNGVWGISHDNVFAVGANGTILRYNGTSWTS
ncbi:MAG: hypothetical protein KAT27_07385, partial [Desulfobacterales bacterium]|nr:hypothetical protein [Desulfobacterales bacterium]